MKALRNRFFGVLTALAASVAVLALAPAGAKAAQLIMLEQDGCHWCEVWNEEIGIAYPKTDEGKLAPLRRVDIHSPLPADLEGLKKANYTPTFVVWHNGREVDRLRGYPGGHFFWPMLQQMLAKIDKAETGTAETPGTAEPKS
ncbi:transcriptional regulator [Anderseniella sp. Alg231-50]|uniref:transcriptional regulator n=1 Tax=Anderseniella sp. Alg231-50 TaxID=1922226 RepID=UPI000D55111C